MAALVKVLSSISMCLHPDLFPPFRPETICGQSRAPCISITHFHQISVETDSFEMLDCNILERLDVDEISKIFFVFFIIFFSFFFFFCCFLTKYQRCSYPKAVKTVESFELLL